MNQTRKIAIALGANIGDKLANLRLATERLGEDVLSDLKASHIYETPPWGFTEQPHFYNAVVIGVTEWKPPAILNYLKSLEQELKRVVTVVNGPRTIDLDLLVYGDETWETEGVIVPHPRLAERDFVLVPLVEIWPDWIHPRLKSSAQTLLLNLQQTQRVHATKIEPLLLDTKTPSQE